MKTSKLYLLVFLSAFMIVVFMYAEHVQAIDIASALFAIILFASIFLYYLNELINTLKNENYVPKLTWTRMKEFLNS